MTAKKKGAEQPVWLLVAILLALIVGVMLFQLLNPARQAKSFEDMMASVDAGTAQLAVETFCNSWKGLNWRAEPEDLEKVSTDYAGRAGLLTKAEWEARDLLSVCDCAVYLYADKRAIERSDVYAAVTNPSTCHATASAKYPL